MEAQAMRASMHRPERFDLDVLRYPPTVDGYQEVELAVNGRTVARDVLDAHDGRALVELIARLHDTILRRC